MRFKANHGRAVGGRNVYLRNGRNQIARQPAKIMISLVISLGHVGFLLEIGYLMNLVVPILIATRVDEEVVVGVSLSIPESLLLSPVAGSVAMRGFWSASPTMEREEWEQRREQ
jgi:hypothetical protein